MDRHGDGLDLPRDLFCKQIFVRTLDEDSRVREEQIVESMIFDLGHAHG